jgi:hypothetical protein
VFALVMVLYIICTPDIHTYHSTDDGDSAPQEALRPLAAHRHSSAAASGLTANIARFIEF